MTGPAAYLSITTPLSDPLTLLSVRGAEGVSQLFEFTLELASGSSSLTFADIVGKSVTVKIAQTTSTTRYINGIVSRFALTRMSGSEGALYQATLVPALWKLQLNADCRIFQQKSVPDIVKAVLQEQGVTAIKDQLKTTYNPRDYCVQYRESAFNFISRLMEEEGISYFFEHADGTHTLVLADDADAHQDCPGINTLQYQPGFSETRYFEDHIGDVSYEEQVVAQGVALGDYNFTTPTTDIGAQTGGTDKVGQVYDYPGGYADKSAGESRAKLQLAALEVPAKRIRGSSRCRTLIAGYKFTLSGHPRSDLNAAHVLLSVGIDATPDRYDNSFTAMPATVPYCPPRVTPKPVIAGSQTALVVGKSGEEIYTDQYGRIKVQFYWDRLGAKDEKSSCFIRVAQGWAGKAWGSWFLPRIGMEVVVSFLEGDPDQPLITGAVYNADQTLPYTLPDKMTTSTILSRSSKQGQAGNEIRFDDTKDSEQVYLHAQKDMLVEVENDRTTTIKAGHETETVSKGNRSVTITEGNESLTVSKGNRSVTVSKGSETLTVSEGDRTVAVDKGKETHSVKSTRSLTVEGAETHTNKDKFTQEVSGDYSLKVSGSLTIEVSGSLTIKGSSDVTVKSGTDCTLQAGTAMTVKSGTDCSVKSGTGMAIQGGTTLDVKGSATGTVDGGGMLTLKGGMVKIN